MNNYANDPRIILTLDAGGTNSIFSAIKGGEEIVTPVHKPSKTDTLDGCLAVLKEGFSEVIDCLPERPSAISFAFPGPADYARGIIGDLPNLPAFRGGVPLGAILEDEFRMPVFINNDGNLYAYGEALVGVLPAINRRLEAMGSNKKYRNLIGVTLGTGFGCGIVADGRLLAGDNSAEGEIWCMRNKKYPEMIVEESVSIRAVKRVYTELTGDTTDLTPKEIFDIAEGIRPGDAQAACRSFAELGEMAGDALSAAVTLIDGVVAVGGGLAGASKYIVPAMVAEMNSNLGMFSGNRFPRIISRVYNLDDEAAWQEFARGAEMEITVPGSGRKQVYDAMKRVGVMTTSQSTSHLVVMGAYTYALSRLDVAE